MAVRTKTIKLDMEKETERELWDFLQTLPHGDFSDWTKTYWFSELNREKVRQMRKEMGK